MNQTRQVIVMTKRTLVILIAALGCAAKGPAQPVSLDGELTPAKRQQLEQRAAKLAAQANQHAKEGRPAEAVPLGEEIVRLRRRLYPKEQFPDGHHDLAVSLNNLGGYLRDRGDYPRAEGYHLAALAMFAKLYPPERFPDGQQDVAICLNNVGIVLNSRGDFPAAERFLQHALAMRRKLYPPQRYPDGHADLATSLENVGVVLSTRGDYVKAEALLREALAMFRKLYPAERFPDGHVSLAHTLNSLGLLLHNRGDLARAEPYYQEALAMFRKLFPPGRFPNGHRDVAICLTNVGLLHYHRNELAQAEKVFRDALTMLLEVYPRKQYPKGHTEVANGFNNLGAAVMARGDLAGAELFYRAGLAIRRMLFPPERFPNGHPHVAESLNNLGVLLAWRGDDAQAEPMHQEALAMYRKLYPPDSFPVGHGAMASCLTNLGGMFGQRGDYKKAEPYLRKALIMRQGLTELFLAGASEAEAMNHLASLPLTREPYLSYSRHLPERHADSYSALWDGKAAIARLLERRHLAMLLDSDVGTGALGQHLLATRRELARQLLSTTGGSEYARRVKELTDTKEKLEKKLARQLPGFAELQAREQLRPADLCARLPADAVFVDLLRYLRLDHDPKLSGIKGERRTDCYVAFVLHKGGAPRRVELGPAGPIDKALAGWRRDLASAGSQPKSAQPAADLRRLLWLPLASQLPPGTRSVYLAPDGPLTALPWAALPGSKPGKILLEEYALAVVPHGRFLADQLRPRRERLLPEDSPLLAVGGVSYDQAAQAVRVPGTSQDDLRAAARSEGNLSWPVLPGTAREVEHVIRLAGKRPIRQRSGRAAGPAQILLDLPEVRYAHLATHGFFADQQLRSILQLDEKLFERKQWGEKVGAGARNPLVLSGLVLAGANLQGKEAPPDGGILTAEAIAGLNLEGLELAVLSACETGLGEVAGGEGVFGLQRAFHIAGAKNVIATLWTVDDDATAALMVLFYHNLWREKLSALEALQQAQLTLYRHPERIPALARQRGPDFDKTARLPAASGAASARRAPARLWAGFVLSGAGR
jgi:CHAT domain-containing protein/Tfp pilus assembly protein PilF